jgi:putative transposase
MGRPIRIEYPGAIYHVMSRGVNGCTTFVNDDDFSDFLGRLQQLVDHGRLVVFTYCLMSNHFHLLCETPLGRLSRWMQQLLGGYSQAFNERYQRSGHLWQERYKAILVQDGDYFLHCSRYIHLNPVEAGVVSDPGDYKWSSFAAYAHPEIAPAWLETRKVLDSFGGIPAYLSFVREGMGRGIVNPFESAVGGIAFGSASFVRQVRLLVRDPLWPDDADGFNQLNALDSFPIDELLRDTSELFSDMRQKQIRAIQIYGLRRLAVQRNRKICELLGMSPSAVTHSYMRLLRTLETDTVLRSRLERFFDRFADGLSRRSGQAGPFLSNVKI